MKQISIKEAQQIEIMTLQDNTVDLVSMDNNAIVTRAVPVKEGDFKISVLAEHGFSAMVRLKVDERIRTFLFDFGFSENGAAHNAKLLGVDMKQVEAVVLSHGHVDHFGGFEKLIDMIGRRNIEMLSHPSSFKSPRYVKMGETVKINFPTMSREKATNSGVKILETKDPRLFLDDCVMFLGEIPRRTEFEKGIPIAYYLENGQEKWDAFEDDTSVVMNLKGKGLIVLSGCAHSGIVNTVMYAQELTGVKKVHAIMGGFHLTGPFFEKVIDNTAEELKKLDPDYIIPTHCTGRKATMRMESSMPEKFILNMSGTKLSFSA